ncbi:aminotransferase class III-fold pyridoxal phosphate-dependent enzyme [Bradyrhizobium pachyrhizi]|uniref:aminotransferase class III-fold pyridoxal phosphate-dependent enzyme n=1 Tax=Bradyrhizobium pachyrhizi TaxID=280333 RepID=UPI000B17DC13|nr:aminotransferase class III-fold pyridoxal phosphate-dependent enzyme [Bradyrhizobium pachyrhizi]
MGGLISERRQMQSFEDLESSVLSYSRLLPAIFSRARGSIVLTESGRKFIDFSSCAGTLNYGHNNHQIRAAIAEYLASDSVIHGPDMETPAKLEFVRTFSSVILQKRDLQYRLQFTGPTGANAIESALMLSREVIGRQNVISFTHGYHGMSLAAIAMSGNRCHRAASGISLFGVTVKPYDGYLGRTVDTAEYLQKGIGGREQWHRSSSRNCGRNGAWRGGINVASKQWLQSIQAVAKSVGALFIVDDIQMGCGRTGGFFSFEFAALSPVIVVLSKSLSGYGLPLNNVVDQGRARRMASRRTHRHVSRKQPCACVRNRSYKSLLALPDFLAGC